MNTEARPVIIEQKAQRIFYRCPKCKGALVFRKRCLGKNLCIQCGQRLDWRSFDRYSFETVKANDQDEAAWLAEVYYQTIKASERSRLDTDDWRKSLSHDGTELYFIFSDNKAHGAFMRKISKEGIIHDG